MSSKVTIQPRLQIERFSLYWKEPLSTDTKCLPAFQLDCKEGSTVQSILESAATTLGWEPAQELQRLEGYNDAWERAIINGRELVLTETLAEQLPGMVHVTDPSNITITFVRKVLKADGWKIRLVDDFLTDSDESDSDDHP